jgi:hypothetical protein
VLTLGHGGLLAGIPLAAFIDLCARLDVAVLWEPEDEIGAEFERLNAVLLQA